MLPRSMIAAFGLLAILGLAWPASGQEPIRAGEHRIPFQLRDGLIYIKARVNGQRATLLLDTGSSGTLFKLRLVPLAQLVDKQTKIFLSKGSTPAIRYPVSFILGDADLRDQHCSFRQDAFIGNFEFEADGLVGEDVLSQFKSITFDFKNSILILENR